jgi:predicted phosphodiesterase
VDVSLRMKSILVFSDLHAISRELQDIIPVLENVDLSFFCGDIIGYGKDIDSCIDFVFNNIDLVVLGNHERLAVSDEDINNQIPAVQKSTLYARSKLTSKQKELLLSLPTEIWYEDLYITHSINDDYLRTETEFEKLFKKMREETKYAFFGHTHEQVLISRNNKTIINPGSITKGRRGLQRGYVLMNAGKLTFARLEPII